MLDFATDKRNALIDHLRRHLEGEVRFDEASRHLYSTDASIFRIKPEGVVIPRTEGDLVQAVQIALETKTPITARGGGTSLSGQSIGPGIVIDSSKFLTNIGPVDVEGRRVVVQPGVVLDQLNAALAPHDLQFGPDVATSNRATLGGMLGNNSAGSRSIVYGQTVHHVHRLKAILSDGSIVEFRPRSKTDWDVLAERPTLEGGVYRALNRILEVDRDEIERRFPNILRRVSGYNLAAYLPKFADSRYATANPESSLIPLVVGSEGTLAVLLEAELNLVAKPKCRGLLVPHFESLKSALDAVAACLEFGPSAVELVDSMMLELARKQPSLKGMMAAIEGEPAALLMVEFASDSLTDVKDRLDRLGVRLREIAGLTACVATTDTARRDSLWKFRSAAVPLLYSIPGDRKPVTFCEDCAVDPARVPEFAMRFREIFQKFGTDGAFYGHASVGCLHIRPLLNLKDVHDVQRMRSIMEEVTSLVLEFGGSLSGEHGDGLVRSEWNRKMYGPVIYEAFRQMKRAFDPENLFNPGKVVDAPAMTENLRLGVDYKPISLPVVFDYEKQEGFFHSIELCNGAGVCRKTQGGAMCPSFRATRDEADSTRGRANALRLALSGQATENPDKPLASKWIYDVMDLCLGCKACKTECPSNVDLAKLKGEFLQAYYDDHRRPISDRLVANIHLANRLGSPFAPLINWMGRRGFLRWGLEKLTGLDRRRPLPQLHRQHFRKWFRKHPPRLATRGKVILLDDCFTTFHEPRIGRAATEILERAGFQVELAGICCGRSLISNGYLKRARKWVRAQSKALAERVADGTPILGLEPSCLLTLADEWTELDPGPETKSIAAASYLADHWLGDQMRENPELLKFAPDARRVLFHGHCHQKALTGVQGSVDAMQKVPECDVTALDAGCCGMAGAFGYERSHYDISVKIANLSLLPALASDPRGTIVATGTSCRHQIRDLTDRQPLHPMEFLKQNLMRE